MGSKNTGLQSGDATQNLLTHRKILNDKCRALKNTNFWRIIAYICVLNICTLKALIVFSYVIYIKMVGHKIKNALKLAPEYG